MLSMSKLARALNGSSPRGCGGKYSSACPMFMSSPTRTLFVSHSHGLYSARRSDDEPIGMRLVVVGVRYFGKNRRIVRPAGKLYLRPGTARYELMMRPNAMLSFSGNRIWLRLKSMFVVKFSLFDGANEKFPRIEPRSEKLLRFTPSSLARRADRKYV